MSLLEETSTVISETVINSMDSELTKNKLSVYSEHDFDVKLRQPLPIDDVEDQILGLLQRDQAIVIKGFTGCGKTTRVPQFILDHCRSTNTACNIAVTQPRRIAAISIAKRVCHERNWPLGTVVGYQVKIVNCPFPNIY